MVQSCSAQYCKERSKRGSGVSFHSFPQDDKIKDQWVRAACRYNFKPQKHSRLCSKHFSPHDFVTNGWSSKQILKKDAVPNTIKRLPIDEKSQCETLVREYPPIIIDNIAIPNEKNKDTINKARNIKIIMGSDLQTSLIEDKRISLLGKTESDTSNQIKSENEVLGLELSSFLFPPEEGNKIFFSTQTIVEEVNTNETDDSDNLTTEDKTAVTISIKQENDVSNNLRSVNDNFDCEHSLEKKKFVKAKELSGINQTYTNKLKERLIGKKKQIKALQQRNRRLVRRINKLNTLMGNQPKPLNNIIKVDSHEVTNMLKPLTPTGRVIIKEMMKTRKSKVYPAELKNFALTLNFYSPKSYLYVGKIFPTMLPHPRTLLKWS